MNEFFNDLAIVQGVKHQSRKRNYAKSMSMSEETYNDITIKIDKILKQEYPYLKGMNLTHGHILRIMVDIIIFNYEKGEKK